MSGYVDLGNWIDSQVAGICKVPALDFKNLKVDWDRWINV